MTIIAFAYAEISGTRRFEVLNRKLDLILTAVKGIIFTFNNTSLLPKQISASVAQPMLLALIQTDGVLLGFVGAVFAVVFGRSHKVSGWVLLVQAGMILASMGFFRPSSVLELGR